MSNKEAPIRKRILTVQDLTLSVDDRQILQDVNFELDQSEILGIVGESGSGKSVTAQSILQLLNMPPIRFDSGRALLNSRSLGVKDIFTLSEEEMLSLRGSEISMIFQEPMTSLNPVFTCGDQVGEAVRLTSGLTGKKLKDKVIELFEDVQLPRPEKIFSAYPHEISGGQKQRVMIAMAMSSEPLILIADEPTTALDVTVQANILQLMQNLRFKHKTSLIFISHDLGVIAEVADRVLVMKEGRIVEQGTVWDIFANPQHAYTKGLLACRPRLDIKLKQLPTVQDFLQNQGEKSRYQSVGEALLLNARSQDEVDKQRMVYMTKPPVLEVSNLSVSFKIRKGLFGQSKDSVRAVDDVSLRIFPGETVGLVGESGCGKTTLGRAIMGLVGSDSGTISFMDRDVTHPSQSELRQLRRDIQIIFQDPFSALNPRMQVGRAITEAIQYHNPKIKASAAREEAVELLELVGLTAEHIYRYPHEFSGGQRQRINIARTLAMKPKFIICDESVSALDVSVQAQVLNLLNKLKRKFGLTYIFISHDLSVVKFVSDRILVMNKGKIVESGFPETLYAKPQEEYTRSLIESIPKGDLKDIREAQLRKKMIFNE